ncbi:hypothetical protein TNCV_856481 [Trichonephila clavipes]|nr:hypothetical protein TNCV_856481 [Trichonephila clavipes]
MVPQLARDFSAVSGREISRDTVNSNLAETGLSTRHPVRYVPLSASIRKDRVLRSQKNISHGQHRKRVCSFQ